ncbi:glycerol-3-phosphate 1-O-acyltransferase PlsY [Aureimonas leprariae]|uniref:Glycerol-3-phosphate acyltransferase n=1 Tax=Plantimonas leprariae TaxID=2615207 RepID=A0A7V7PS36_9HYPH|nr:glycerol-3-phosphate 1-O-acyltransferase PlsY [Aureimonas leprariae]KAB0681840.1 glycerol-3-phosphate 1-O-acyltransferase PlsY [Aureimonas leprariae]
MTAADFLPLLALFVVGYLCGTIPFGLLLARIGGHGDIRKIGSGNIGATNVLRTGNKSLAAATLLGDLLKGTVPVLVGHHFAGDAGAMAGGAGAFLGHLFPVWLGFKGGKGVATYIGVLLGLAPVGVLVFAVAWLLVAYLTRYSSAAALTATVAVPVAYALLGFSHFAIFVSVLSAIVWIKHEANIRRLLSGSESRIGAKG